MEKPRKNIELSPASGRAGSRLANPPALVRVVLAAAIVVLVSLFGTGRAGHATENWPALGTEVVETVGARFYDSTLAGAWADRHAGYADAARSQAEFVALTRQALSRLGVSHTAYYTPLDPEYYGLRAIFRRHLEIEDVAVDGIGADIDADGFVRCVFVGRPAAEAGLLRGDRVLTADGRDFERVKSFEGRAGGYVTLAVERQSGGEPVELRVIPQRVDPEEEWLAAQRGGARMIERGGRKVAYVPVYSCAGAQYEDLVKELIADKMQGTDALIIDFRGGWGGCNTSFVDIFHAAPAVMRMITRDGETIVWDEHWRKPLYVLIDGGTRSGKEVVAYSIKKHGLGMLVGEKTAGAVVAGSCFKLSDGSLLYLAVADVYIDGERLEGVGVEPDVFVESGLRYSAGADPQLEAAVDLAVKRQSQQN